MQAATGNIACQAAAFVFKTDDTVSRAWEEVNGIPHIRAEIHDDRQAFLAAVGAWNGRASMEPDNAYLGIYAHMGRRGLSPARPDHPSYRAENRITWADLAAALPRGVHTCWLVGCGSVAVLNRWDPLAGASARDAHLAVLAPARAVFRGGDRPGEDHLSGGDAAPSPAETAERRHRRGVFRFHAGRLAPPLSSVGTAHPRPRNPPVRGQKHVNQAFSR